MIRGSQEGKNNVAAGSSQKVKQRVKGVSVVTVEWLGTVFHPQRGTKVGVSGWVKVRQIFREVIAVAFAG